MTRRAGGDEEEEKSPDLCFLVGLGGKCMGLCRGTQQAGQLEKKRNGS